MRQLINMKQTDCLHESQVTGVCVCTFANNEQIISNKKPSNRRKSHLYIQVFDTHLFKKDVHHLPSTKNKSYSELVLLIFTFKVISMNIFIDLLVAAKIICTDFGIM